jgi:uncharacterized membrane protein (UPF0127 family)
LASRPARLQRQDGRVVCEHLLVASRPLRRMRGLLGRRGLAEGEGILLRPAGSIHTFFMRFAIDAVFLDRDLVVIGIEPALGPWRTAGRRGAKSVVELASGECERRGIEVGDALTVST